jgi:hypothetical protein
MNPVTTLIETWAHSIGCPPDTPLNEPKLSVSFDQVRVHLSELPNHLLLVESRVCDLPTTPTEQDRVVNRLLGVSLARMQQNPASVCVDAEHNALWLQRRLSNDITPDQLNTAIESLVNEIDLWRSLI